VNKNPTDATVCRYLFTAKLLYMFRVSQHPSAGVLKLYPQPPVKVILLVVVLVAGFSLPHGYHPNSATPKFQNTSKQEHTSNVVIQ